MLQCNAFRTHMHRTESPVPKMFGTNTCTVRPLIVTLMLYCYIDLTVIVVISPLPAIFIAIIEKEILLP